MKYLCYFNLISNLFEGRVVIKKVTRTAIYQYLFLYLYKL